MVGTIAFDIDELREYAAKAGLGLQFVAKEAFLFELMELMNEHAFVLKGGTAINKGYLAGHQRFSEDLDYDSSMNKEQIRKALKEIGWPIKKEFFTRRCIGFMLPYSFGGFQDAVKIEVSSGLKGGHGKKELSSDFLPVSKRVDTYLFSELNLQKEAAICERREWKDLYDLYWMNSLYPLEFRIANKTAFREAISLLSVPKTANSFIPIAKRPNWEKVKEEMSKLTDSPS